MSSPTVASVPAAKSSLWEDFIDIFYAPAQVFERRRDGRFGPALAVIAVVGTLLFFAFRPMYEAVTDAAFTQSIRSNPELSPEQVAAMRAMGSKFGVVGGIFQALVGYPVLIALTALVIWPVGRAFGATQNFARAMTIATYANVPRLLGTAVSGTLFALGRPDRVVSPNSISLSPLRFMDEASLSVVTAALVSRFDLFTLWTTALIAVGLHVIGGVAKSKAALAAALVWLVATMFFVASAARNAA